MSYQTTIPEFWQTPNSQGRFEDKITSTGAYNVFMADTPNLIPNIQSIIDGKANPNQVLKFPVFKKNEQAVGTVRTLAISATEGTSALQSITFSTLVYNIALSPASFAGNSLSFQEALAKELDVAQIAMLRAADAAAAAALDANKNLVDKTGGYPFAFATGVYSASNAQKDDLLNAIPEVLNANEFDGDNTNIVGSIETRTLIKGYEQFAQYNAQNKALALAGKNFFFSNRIARGTDNQLSLYAIPKGSLAVVPFIESDARQNINLGNTKYYVRYMPKLGLNVGVYEIDGAADRSAIDGAGFEHAAVINYQLSVDLAFITPYNSDTATITAPVHKFVLTNA